ncbi:MAG: helix-turn-helix domain-containing protein [Clostridia bacterium]|nr:helix-turn-helix domain-containing protein [Clostridia bacterium]
MKTIRIAEQIAELRKRKGITQEQLASALHISPQAVSKWETNTSQPDTQTLPLIAEYFGVSIDYLFYGQDVSYDDIYPKVFKKIESHPQMSKMSYEDVIKIFGYAHYGMARWNPNIRKIYDEPMHVSNENGVSLISGRGYGAILTRAFFESINKDTAEFATTILPALSEMNNLLVCMAIVAMSDISYAELQEKLGFDDATLRASLDSLIASKLVVEKKSKHKSLGLTYEINSMYHTCLCILLATVEMQRFSNRGISCCMGYGDFPIQL